MARNNEIGKWGEQLAVDKLVSEGYSICERNWREGHNEIDIIAIRGDEIVFAEVKTRSNPNEDPLEAVDRRKISHMIHAGQVYIRMKGIRHQWRFDLFAISGTPASYTLEHIPDAFLPPLRTRR